MELNHKKKVFQEGQAVSDLGLQKLCHQYRINLNYKHNLILKSQQNFNFLLQCIF